MKTNVKKIMVVIILMIFTMVHAINQGSNIQSITVRNIKFKTANEQIDLSIYNEKPVFQDIVSLMPNEAIANENVAKIGTNSSVALMNTNLFSNKRITKIGIPVKTVSNIDGNQTFTLNVISKSATPFEYVKKYTIKLPVEQLGDNQNVNKWIYVDLSHLDIKVGEDETLSFGASTDTVSWVYKKFNSSEENNYNFINSSMEWDNEKQLTSVNGLLFDIYTTSLAYNLPENQKQELKNILNGKNISILGDSISTFTGYSNNASYNTTLTTNNNCYSTSNTKRYVISVNQTWWMPVINKTGMSLLVNNSSGGDTISNKGITRAMQLHSDTGADAGTKPDIIAVYLGTNDARAEDSLDVFETNYKKLINTLTTTYTDAEIFFFTILPTEKNIDEDSYNNVIRELITSSNDKKLHLVDIYNKTGITENNQHLYQGDNLHPNISGMELISSTFMNSLATEYLSVEEEQIQNIEKNPNTFSENYLVRFIPILTITLTLMFFTTKKNKKTIK